MLRRSHSSMFFFLMGAMLFLGSSAIAQGRPHPHAPAPAPQEEQAPAAQPNEAHSGGNAADRIPPQWVEHLQQMSPEEQERFLKNNARFQQLTPAEQAQIRERLRTWNNMNPDEKQALRDRQRVWEQLSPEQRNHIKQDLLPKWQKLPEERKQVILSRMRVLSSMSPADRAAKLNDPNFMRGLNPDEQDMLRNISTLRGGAPAPSAGSNP